MKNARTLVVDLGNARLKWAIQGDVPWRMEARAVQGHDVSTVLTEAWQDLPKPDAIVMATVSDRALSAAVNAWTVQHWSVEVHTIAAQAELLGVRNNYRQPETLGADRWAALIGARAETQADVCVVDCGTAVTVDALTVAGEFAGGVILPGLALARAALTNGTARIREMEGNEISCLAWSTGDAVAAGTLFGLVGAVERVWREFEQTLARPMELIITGGDAEAVRARLSRPARHVPDLVLKGLARIGQTL